MNRMPRFDDIQISKIHSSVMEVLRDVGVAFNDPEGIEIFKAHGFKTEGSTVFFQETQVMKAIEQIPSQYTIHARNPEKNVMVGHEHFALLPGWGSPFMIDADGEQRNARMADYDNFCKLVHTSPFLDMNGYLMVMPADIDPEISHLSMMLSNMLLSDKAFMGSPQDRSKAKDALEMTSILFGGQDNIKGKNVVPSKINPISPLIYSEEMVGALIEYARFGQPLEFPNLLLCGTSAPITLAGSMVVKFAETLAGTVLVQLINPGTPCVVGGCSCATDMKTGGMGLGGPEAIQMIQLTGQLGQFYGIPTKAGGSLTDAFFPDMQAGVESALTMFVSLASGNSYMNQACGILAGFNAMSYEKFLIDEESCGMIRRILKPVEVTDETIGLEQIKKAGIGGAYLMFPETFKKCRTELFTPELATRGSYDKWHEKGKKQIWQKAETALQERLEAYQRPDIDPGIEKDLKAFVEKRTAQII